MPRDFRTNARRMNRTKRDALRWASWRAQVRSASRICNLQVGADAPKVSGPSVQVAYSNASAYSAEVVISNFSSNTGKYYLEVRVDELTTMAEYMGFGVKRASVLGGPANGSSMLGAIWSVPSGVWLAIWNATGNNTTQLTTGEGAHVPEPGSVIGVAIDCANDKLFIHHNGSWLTGAGSVGGDPSNGGLGVSITNAVAEDMHLFMYGRAGDHFTLSFRDGQQSPYRPTDYEPIS